MNWPTEVITPPAVFRRVVIPKRRGGHRAVYVVAHRRVKTFLNTVHNLLLTHMVVPALYRYYDYGVIDAVHGFVPGRSPISCAARHVGFDRTVAMDLEDFFPSCTYEKFIAEYRASQSFESGFALIHSFAFQLDLPELLRVRDWTPAHTLGLLFPDGAAQQGLPTSPDMANLTAIPMDRDILWTLYKHRLGPANYVYTRYADDLTVSHDSDAQTTELVIALVRGVVTKHGFRLNERKTQRYWAGAGSRVVVGVSLPNRPDYPEPMRPCRATRRRYHAVKQAVAHLDPSRFESAAKAVAEKYRLSDRLEGMTRWFEQFKSPKWTHLRGRPHHKPQKPPEWVNRVVEVHEEDTLEPLEVRPPPISLRRLDQ